VTLPNGTFDLGPSTGRLLVRTGRDGVAARVGHDLAITFENWSGQLTLRGDDLGSATVTASFETGSIKVLEGSGGALPLTIIDRREIRKTALRLLEVDRHPTATFASTSIKRAGEGGTIEGTLTIRGESVPVTIAVSATGSGWRGSTSIRQTSFGIKPYRAFLGALRLADEVGIEVTISGQSLTG
jgi:polyisoprenoid-binding protein YceI